MWINKLSILPISLLGSSIRAGYPAENPSSGIPDLLSYQKMNVKKN